MAVHRNTLTTAHTADVSTDFCENVLFVLQISVKQKRLQVTVTEVT